MPAITTIASPKNPNLNISIEKINKNISDSINKGNTKEMQLI